jgi:uncharacterized Zn-binding protein involved in type VI secretion
MGTPAAVKGDQITATCEIHLIPNPGTGAPQPAPPLPFSAPVVQQTVDSVLITGKPAVVEGSWGLNTPPHAGLHPADPYMPPTQQVGRVVHGSGTVLIGGSHAATQASSVTVCGSEPGTLKASASTVLIGG